MDPATLEAHSHQPGRPLEGTPVAATWESALLPALATRGTALQEEQLLEDLLRDLIP